MILDAARLGIEHRQQGLPNSNPHSPLTDWHNAYNMAHMSGNNPQVALTNAMLPHLERNDIYNLISQGVIPTTISFDAA
jgi:hypothetical protein